MSGARAVRRVPGDATGLAGDLEEGRGVEVVAGDFAGMRGWVRGPGREDGGVRVALRARNEPLHLELPRAHLRRVEEGENLGF